MSLPTRFRIFTKGWNGSTKGKVLFDDKAAAMVMSEYNKHGADLMLDLEHLSLKPDAPNYDPNARGWCRLEVLNGELWAVVKSFTPDGAQRLESKTQRYISPAFWCDKVTKRVTSIINAALTALPASDMPMALVTANQTSGLMAFSTIGTQMDLSVLIQLLGLPPEATLDDIVAAVKALQGGGTAPAGPEAPVASSEPGNGGATAAPPATGSPASTTGVQPSPKKTTVSIQHSQPDESAAAVIELTQTVRALQAERTADKRNALIAANSGKLTPTLERWAQTQSVESLTAFFAAAGPAEQVDTEAQRETQQLSQGGSQAITLSQAEIDTCELTGVDPKAALEYKISQSKVKAK
jgi:hypothetical protein